MRILSRTPLPGGCVVLRGNFGAPLVSTFRAHWIEHVRAAEILREKRVAANPLSAPHFDAYLSRLRAYIAGRSDISSSDIRSQYHSLRSL